MNRSAGNKAQLPTERAPVAGQVPIGATSVDHAAPMTNALDEYDKLVDRLRAVICELESTLEPVLLPVDPQPTGPGNPPLYGESPRHTRLLNKNLDLAQLISALVEMSSRIRP